MLQCYVNNKCYVWSELQGRVVVHTPGEAALERNARSASPGKLHKGPHTNIDRCGANQLDLTFSP